MTTYLGATTMGLSVRQPFPRDLLENTWLNDQAKGLDFHVGIDRTLVIYPETQRPGVHVLPDSSFKYQILARIQGQDTLWGLELVEIPYLDRRLNVLTGKAEEIKALIAAKTPYDDHEEYSARTADLIMEHDMHPGVFTARQVHGISIELEAMQRPMQGYDDALKRFLSAQNIQGSEFMNVLSREDLWHELWPSLVDDIDWNVAEINCIGMVTVYHGWKYPPLLQRLACRLRLAHWDDKLDGEEESDG